VGAVFLLDALLITQDGFNLCVNKATAQTPNSSTPFCILRARNYVMCFLAVQFIEITINLEWCTFVINGVDIGQADVCSIKNIYLYARAPNVRRSIYKMYLAASLSSSPSAAADHT
jgi:hypothetical protein